MLALDGPKAIVDIGPYTNPIWNYLPEGYCPELIVAVEPCGEVATNSTKAWQSIMRPCQVNNGNTKTSSVEIHVIVIPMTARQFFDSPFFRASSFDAAVCVGCDAEYGPKLSQLANLRRPFFLYIEYPPSYRHSKLAFNKRAIATNVCGAGTKPQQTKEWKFDPNKETQLKGHEHSFHRLLSTYKCTRFQKKWRCTSSIVIQMRATFMGILPAWLK